MGIINQPYNIIIYAKENGFIQQITNTNNPNGFSNLPDTLEYMYIDFYNEEILACYFDSKNNKYYEDEKKIVEIIDPSIYIKPTNEN